jgi:hypothetical protein
MMVTVMVKGRVFDKSATVLLPLEHSGGGGCEVCRGGGRSRRRAM